MILQIRGTSGSGKTTLVKNIMQLYKKPFRKVYREGRKQPLYYVLEHPIVGLPSLAVIGQYETVCGGCDTITVPGQSYKIIFDAIQRNVDEGNDILFEGLLVSGDLAWSTQLKQHCYINILLDVPVEECLASVNERRKVRFEKAGKEFIPVKEANTIAKHRLILKCRDRLQNEYGINVETHNRENALQRVKELLCLTE